MKKSIYIILAVALMAASACKTTVQGVVNDTVKKPPVVPKSVMTAFRDSIAWTADPSNSSILNDTITLYGKGTTHGAPADTLIFKLKYTGAASYPLDSTQVSYHSVPVNDTSLYAHKIDKAYPNSIDITYDMSKSTITGTFNVKFLDPGAKDISFLNGNFTTPLK